MRALKNTLLCMAVFSAVSQARAENSISDLPLLAPVLIHHYTCRLALAIDRDRDDYQEVNFSFDPHLAGSAEVAQTLILLKDQVQAQANAQTLDLKWLRDGKVIAHSMTQIQNSSTQAMALFVSDPQDEQSQAQFSCLAVTFKDLKKTAAPLPSRGGLQ